MCFSRKMCELGAAGGFATEAGGFTVAIQVDSQFSLRTMSTVSYEQFWLIQCV